MRRLLILACSARKKTSERELPAWDLYDGVAFRVVKNIQRQDQLYDKVCVKILSAEYGLISSTCIIVSYERKITSSRAEEIQPQVLGGLKQTLEKGDYGEVFIFAGNTYLKAMRPFDFWCPIHVHLIIAEGGIGQKLHQLKVWLLTGKL